MEQLVDYSAHGDFMLSSNIALSGLMQYEPWKFPVLCAIRQSNVVASVKLTLLSEMADSQVTPSQRQTTELSQRVAAVDC
jgi:hypothetical protein